MTEMEERCAQAEREGYASYFDKNLEDNPYIVFTPEYDAWEKGWYERKYEGIEY